MRLDVFSELRPLELQVFLNTSTTTSFFCQSPRLPLQDMPAYGFQVRLWNEQHKGKILFVEV